MQPRFEQEILIPPSACDYSGKLGYAGAFAVLMDLATEHAERLGIGLAAMKAKNRFWVTVKTKIIFYERPAVSEAVRLITWPEKPGAVKGTFTVTYEDEYGQTYTKTAEVSTVMRPPWWLNLMALSIRL